MRSLNTLNSYFIYYLQNSIQTDTTMYADFWTEVAVLWNKMEGGELTNNAVRKRFRRRKNNVVELYNSDDRGDLSNYIKSIADDLYILERDTSQFYEDIIAVLSDDTFEFEETTLGDLKDSPKELTETEFKKDEKIRQSSIIQETDLPYYYNETTGTYVFMLSSSKKPLIIEQEDFKALKRRYSNWDGEVSTINEICRDFGIPRKWFTELKTKLGWTHDSDPFTDREVMDKDHDQLVEEVLENKRRKLYQKMRMKEWDEVQDKARKYDEIDAFVVQPLTRLLEEKKGGFEPFNINLDGIQKPSELYFVFAPTDLHMNKLPYDINKFSPNQYEKEIEKSTEKILNKLFNTCTPKEIVSIVGSDLFHVDNTDHSTSAGTSQAGQVFGSYYDVLMSSYNVMYNIADLLVSTGITNDMYTIKGNHDAILSLGIGMSLEQRYRGQDNFTINNTIHDRKYKKIGKYLIGMSHGEKLKQNQTTRTRDLQGRILTDAKEFSIETHDIISYYMFSGHVHRTSANHHEDTGIVDIVCPSLSVTDWWHYLNNYTGNTRAMAGYLISPTEGLQYIIYDNMNLIDYKS